MAELRDQMKAIEPPAANDANTAVQKARARAEPSAPDSRRRRLMWFVMGSAVAVALFMTVATRVMKGHRSPAASDLDMAPAVLPAPGHQRLPGLAQGQPNAGAQAGTREAPQPSPGLHGASAQALNQANDMGQLPANVPAGASTPPAPARLQSLPEEGQALGLPAPASPATPPNAKAALAAAAAGRERSASPPKAAPKGGATGTSGAVRAGEYNARARPAPKGEAEADKHRVPKAHARPRIRPVATAPRRHTERSSRGNPVTTLESIGISEE